MDVSYSLFIMDGVTVQISGDQQSIDRVMDRIYKTSDRLGNYLPTAVVVPSPRTKDDYEQDEDEQIDAYAYGHMDGWNSCRECMTAAMARAAGEGV